MRFALLPRFHAIAGGVRAALTGGLRFLAQETRLLLALDIFAVVLLAVALGPFLASLARYADSAQAMAALMDDDALISMQLDGMTAWPWGNPGNFLDDRRWANHLPDHWAAVGYANLPYYGGLYPGLAFVLWAPLHFLGVPFLPTGPVILRALAHLFTAFFLLAGYNLLRLHVHRVAAMLAMLYAASEYWLYQIGARIHPDSLLFFLMVLYLHLCIRHAQSPGRASLVALAITAGLAQAAKMGGPALVPLTIAALAIAHGDPRKGAGVARWGWRVLRDGLAAAAIGVAVFFATTPYALLDSYFFRTWAAWAKVFSGTSPISPTTFHDWWEQAAGTVGAAMLALALAGCLATAVLRAGRERWLPMFLLACLGTSVFLYYALFQKYWVQLQYLVVAYWCVGAIAAAGLALLPALLPRTARRALYAVFLAGGLALFAFRFQHPLMLAFQQMHWRESPQYAIGEWARQHLPPSTAPRSLVSDAPTYFPRDVVPRYTFLAAPLRYVDLATRQPDYFLLTRYSGNWQAAKITGTRHDPWDGDSYNMRLYQDLLGTGAASVDTSRPSSFATRLQTIGWTSQEPISSTCSFGTWSCAPVTPARIMGMYETSRLGVANSRSVSLYRLEKEKLFDAVPPGQRILLGTPIASSTAADANLPSILRGGSGWRSGKTGTDAVGEFVGIALPDGVALAPREATIRWVALHWLPAKLAIEHSDDGKAWTTAAVHGVAQPSEPETRKSGVNRWDETFALPTTGPHRYWRVRAVEMPAGNYFGLERLSMR